MRKFIRRFRLWSSYLRVFLLSCRWPTKNEVEDEWLTRTLRALYGSTPLNRPREYSCTPQLTRTIQEEDKVEQREVILETALVQFIQGKIE